MPATVAIPLEALRAQGIKVCTVQRSIRGLERTGLSRVRLRLVRRIGMERLSVAVVLCRSLAGGLAPFVAFDSRCDTSGEDGLDLFGCLRFGVVTLMTVHGASTRGCSGHGWTGSCLASTAR